MLVTDRRLAGGADRLVAAVSKAVEAGVNAVQLREKDLPEEELLHLARRLREATRGRALLIVNGSLTVALQSGADGLHLPEASPRPEKTVGLLLGRSVHSVDAARKAEAEGAGYVLAGPVFETPSHPGEAPAGIRLIRGIATAVRLPVIAIGGITPDAVGPVMRGGASGVAVISAILGQRSVSGGARMMREALDVAFAPTNGASR